MGKRNQIDFITGVCTTLFGILLLVYIIPTQVILPPKFTGIGPDIFPKIIAWVTIFLGACLTLQSIAKDRQVASKCIHSFRNISPASKKVALNVSITMGIIIGYLLLIFAISAVREGFGFLIANVVAVFAMGSWFKWKNKISLLIISVATSGCLYVVFDVLLKIELP